MRVPDVHPRRAGPRLRTLTLVCALLLVAVPAPPAIAVPGMLDPSFGTGGIVTTSYWLNHEEDPAHAAAYAVTMAPDGRIVVGGATTFPYEADSGFGLPPTNFLVARYHPNGVVDAGFTDPWGDPLVTDVAGEDDVVRAVTVQPDGRVIAAGSATIDGDRHFALVRYLEDGTPDAGFGDGGKVVTPWPDGESQIESILLQPNGRIVVAGWTYLTSGGAFALARYRDDGTLDNSFGSEGRATLMIGDTASFGLDAARQPDGRLVVAGRSGSDIAVARFLSNGNLDVGFGDNGSVVTSVGIAGSVANAVRIREDGGIVVAGTSITTIIEEDDHSDSVRDVTLVSYLSDGSLDPWFGINSVVTRDVTGTRDTVRGLELDVQGRLLVAGSGHGRMGLSRFLPHGDVDPTFGDGGSTVTAPSGARTVEGLVVQPDGKPVVVGHRPNPFESLASDVLVARFTIVAQLALDLDIVVTPRREPIDSILGSAREPGSGEPVPGVRLRFLVDGEVVGIADTDEHGEARVPPPRRGLNATSIVRVEVVGDHGREAGGVEARYHPRTGIDTRADDDGGSGPDPRR